MFCCCFNNKSNENEILIHENKRNERIIISTSHSNSKKNESYEPPEINEINENNQRLSLPISPAQKETNRSNTLKHRKKAGYVKKKGHLVKNWKKRYLVLKGYYFFIIVLLNFFLLFLNRWYVNLLWKCKYIKKR